MKNRTTSILMALLSFCFCLNTGLMAQSTSVETQLILEMWGIEKKEIFRQNMALSIEQAEAFWPLYQQYASARQDLAKERIAILQDYSQSYQNLNNEMADELMLRLFKNNLAIEKLQHKYYNKIKKAVNPLQAAHFVQIEKYLEAAIRMETQNALPFIGELEQMRVK